MLTSSTACCNTIKSDSEMLSRLKQTAKKVDMFSTTQFLRYKEETEYASLTGACLSVAIMVVIIFLVQNVVGHTIRKDEVIWEKTTIKESMPSDVDIPLKDFKFGITVFGLNLNDPNISYFDVAVELVWADGQLAPASQFVPVSPCKLEDWSDSADAKHTYENAKGYEWMCPDQSAIGALGGKWTTGIEKIVYISLTPCGVVDTTKTNCASDAQVANYFARVGGTSYMVLMMVNPLIQAGELQPVTKYVEDSYYSSFNINFGQVQNVYISEYQIQTDNSLLPFEDSQIVSGLVVSEESSRSFLATRVANNSMYSGFSIRKSPSKLQYSRSFHKLDETVSYAGGLIGVVVGIFFFMSPYTELCFELSLANRLFCDKEGKPIKSSMNFIKFLAYCLYTLLNCCCSCVDWKDYSFYTKCSEQVQKELDVSYLLRRINTLQRVISTDLSLKKTAESGYLRMGFEDSEEKAEKMNTEPPESQKDTQTLSVLNQVQNSSQFKFQAHPWQQNLDLEDGSGMEPIIVRPVSEQPSQRQNQSKQKRQRPRHHRKRVHSAHKDSVSPIKPPHDDSQGAHSQL